MLCDTKGVVYRGRTEGMNQWKSAPRGRDQGAHARRGARGRRRRLRPVGQGRLHGRHGPRRWRRIRSSSPWPIPIRRSRRRRSPRIRDDAIIATGRSDYPNQVNNVLGFPYIFRGALDVRATTINMEMKIAAAQALAELAREDVPDEVAAAYQGSRPRFGRDYIIPVPFDPRLIHTVPPAVAEAAMDTGVARRPIIDMRGLQGAALGAARSDRRHAEPHLRARAQVPEARRLRRGRGGAGDPRRALLRQPGSRHGDPRRPRGAGARDGRVSRASISTAAKASRSTTPRLSHRNTAYAQFLYERLQRKGFLFRDCQRLINQDRNHFAASMVALGDADAMVTGVTRNYSIALDDVRRVIDAKPGHRVIGVSMCSGARPHRPRRRHGDPRDAERGRNWRRSPSRPRASRAASATSRASRSSPSRPSATPRASAPRRCRRRCSILDRHARRFRVRRRDGGGRRAQPRADGAVSVLPPRRARRTCSSCRPSTRPRSRPRCCRSSAARR